MSMLEVFKNHTPVENPEYGQKKKLVGDAVAQVKSLDKITSKKGSEWVILKCEAIHAVADPKGRETTIEAGDELTKMYDPKDTDSMMALSNDLFTAGIEVDSNVESESELLGKMGVAAQGKLIYFRTWAKDKNEEQLAKNPNPSFFQNIIIKSKNLITPENSTPQLPF